jgi:hypothetical protein
MAKKKKETKEVPTDLSEWTLSDAQVGTPTMVMFPARNFHFRVAKNEHEIVIPRKGNYHEIAPEVFPKEDGDFMVYDEENAVMYLPAITKILFAVEKYPDLESNQLFAPIALVIDEDEVHIIGQVIEMLPPPRVRSTVAK